MNKFRYLLEPYKGKNTRYKCPQCNNYQSFTRYIDWATGEYINSSVGKCNREIKCGYHFKPKQYYESNRNLLQKLRFNNISNMNFSKPQIISISYIPLELYKASLQSNLSIHKIAESNNFIKFLLDIFWVDITNELVAKYFISTSKHWKGANVFWQVDREGKIRAGKIMLYSPETGKRVKQPYDHINWVHSALKMSDFNLKQCFFGEHLLIDKSKIVMVVESEKTAIISNAFMPNYIWLACGGINNINKERCDILKGRNVIFHPDIGAYEKWNSKVKEFSASENFTVSKLLEENADIYNLKNGSDIADYFIQNRDKDFGWVINNYGYPLFWD
jgi:hypothetical protein